MRPYPELLFDSQCPTAVAAVRVLSAFGYVARPVSAWHGAPGFPVLLVHERAGDRLPPVELLRREGFRGPVVVLTHTNGKILERHRVLSFGRDAVAVWSLGRPLRGLVETIQELRPLGRDTLRWVQDALNIPADFLVVRVEPCLAQFRFSEAVDAALQELSTLIQFARTCSPPACHKQIAVVGGGKAKITDHFTRLLTVAATDPAGVVDELAEVFRFWHHYARVTNA